MVCLTESPTCFLVVLCTLCFCNQCPISHDVITDLWQGQHRILHWTHLEWKSSSSPSGFTVCRGPWVSIWMLKAPGKRWGLGNCLFPNNCWHHVWLVNPLSSPEHQPQIDAYSTPDSFSPGFLTRDNLSTSLPPAQPAELRAGSHCWSHHHVI